MFIYSQSTGKFVAKIQNETETLAHDITLAYGYSGFGVGKNNPLMQDVKDIGPLPCGFYVIELIKDENGNACDYEGKKSPVFRLKPNASNEMFRRDGLLIHGDSVHTPGTASHGCLIEDHITRVLISDAVKAGDNILQVVR